MNTLFIRIAGVIALIALAFSMQPAMAQRPHLRGSQARFGVALGVFTYHGRIDLTESRSRSNFTHASDPAAVFLGSFPIIRDRLFFRGMAGLTNLSALGTRGIASTNEFLHRELLWFEPQVIFTPLAGSKHPLLPYVYTGFGSLIADPFGGPSGRVDRPDDPVPGPDRSVFTWPLGVGIDYPVGPRFSVFADASFRINFNYVGRNATRRSPHNSSLVLFGIRFNLAKPEEIIEKIPPVELPDPLPISPYEPPLPAPEFPEDRCVLAALNTVYFTSQTAAIDPETQTLLDENVEALRLNPACCAMIVGYTDGADTEQEALRISRDRAEFVFHYYTERDVSEDRLAIRSRGTALPCLRKEDPECLINRRVESEMLDCREFPGRRD